MRIDTVAHRAMVSAHASIISTDRRRGQGQGNGSRTYLGTPIRTTGVAKSGTRWLKRRVPYFFGAILPPKQCATIFPFRTTNMSDITS